MTTPLSCCIVPRIHARTRRGFSLIEVVVYVAIFAVLSALTVNILLSFSQELAAIRVTRALNANAVVAMERIIREIRQAKDIVESESTLGSSPGALTLDTYVQPGGEAAIKRKFSAAGGSLALQEGSSPSMPLTAGVTVTNLTFWSTVQPNVYYVRVSGSDTNDGATPDTAFRTITKAASVVAPGVTVYVGAGTYAESNINPVVSGTAASPVSFIADVDGAKTGDPGAVVINGGGVNQPVVGINGRSYIVVDGFTVTNAGIQGVIVKSGSNNVTIRNIISHSNDGDGFAVNNASDVTFANILSYNNPGDGIELDKGSRITIRDGTFYGNNDRGIRIEDSSSNVTLRDNIINSNPNGGIKLAANSTGGYSGDYNLNTDGYQISASPGPHDINADPKFVDPNGADNTLGGSGWADDQFQLSQIASGQGSNSPALDAGSQSASAAGLANRTTRTDQAADSGAVDMGFHYRIPQPGAAGGQLPASQAIRVELTLSAGSGKYVKQQTFYGTAVLRGSY